MKVAPIGGWTGEEFTGQNIESHVYSNKQSYGNYYDASEKETAILTSSNDALSRTVVESRHNRILIEIDPTHFDNHTSVLRMSENIDIDGDGDLDVAGVEGSFNGVEGTFICSGDLSADHVCGAVHLLNGQIVLGEVHVLDDNEVDTDGGGPDNGEWTFEPNDTGSMVASYASFGYWIKTDSNGNPDRIGSFHDLTGREKYEPTSDANLDRITGQATYTGAAVGRYAFYDAGDADESSYGSFTADVTLNADFGTDRINGTINGFMTEDSTGGSRNGSNTWQVDLESTGFNNMGEIGYSATTGDVTWTIEGDEYKNQGSRWSGNFRHFAADDDTTNPSNIAAPAAAPEIVTGKFSAFASDSSGDDFARMLGAFGAERGN